MTPDWVTDHMTGQVTFYPPCLCLFTYVWSHDLFGKLYIVLMLREPTSLSFNINFNTLILSSLSEVDLVTGGPAYMLSPSLPLGSLIWTMEELIVTIGRIQKYEITSQSDRTVGAHQGASCLVQVFG